MRLSFFSSFPFANIYTEESRLFCTFKFSIKYFSKLQYINFIVLFFPELSFSTNWQLILFLLQSEVVFNIIVNIADELYK